MMRKEALRNERNRILAEPVIVLIRDQPYEFVWKEGEVIDLVKEEEEGESATTRRTS